MRSSQTSRRGALVVGLCGLAVAALLLSPVGKRRSEAPTPANNGEVAPGTAAMRVHIDPETGTLLPGVAASNKADAPELQQALSRSTDGLVEVHHPDGSVSVNLRGRFQSASMARIDSNGTLHTSCVESLDAHPEEHATPTTTKPEER